MAKKTAATLKLGGAEPILPGLALPEAFESLDKRIESTVQFCRLKGSVESQILGLVTVCQEMQRLLKFAFIENGLLASRIEILTRHQTESLKKIDKNVSEVELEHKVTKKQIKRLRKRLSVYEAIQRKKSGEWWDVKVSGTDYDSLTTLSRSAGYPDLEFMLRINQILIDFVKDHNRNELVLPPMGQDERAEVSKIASIYKLRCRYGKSTTLAPSTLIKARQTSIPLTGEVDSLLENFAKNHKRLSLEEGSGAEIKPDSPAKPGADPLASSSLTISDIPPTMLTPLSSLSSPNTIDIGSTPISVTPVQSPTGVATPTPSADGPSNRTHTRKPLASTSSTSSSSSISGVQQATPKSAPLTTKGVAQPRPQGPSSGESQMSAGVALQKGGGATDGVGGVSQGSGDHATPSKSLAGGVATLSPVQRQAHAAASIFIAHQGQVRPLVPPTVVASPIKFPPSHLSTSAAAHGGSVASNNTLGTGGGGVAGSGESGSNKRERERESLTPLSGGPTPLKRIRVTRKSASGNGEE